MIIHESLRGTLARARRSHFNRPTLTWTVHRRAHMHDKSMFFERLHGFTIRATLSFHFTSRAR